MAMVRSMYNLAQKSQKILNYARGVFILDFFFMRLKISNLYLYYMFALRKSSVNENR